jgi:predicted metal-dependent hydrolase
MRAAGQTLDEAQRLLDAGRPFHAHEVFEDAWKASRGAVEADLWKGLAQLAVGYTHRLRGNAVGAERLCRRAAAALAPYADAAPYDIDIAQLRAWALDSRDRPMPVLRRAV